MSSPDINLHLKIGRYTHIPSSPRAPTHTHKKMKLTFPRSPITSLYPPKSPIKIINPNTSARRSFHLTPKMATPPPPTTTTTTTTITPSFSSNYDSSEGTQALKSLLKGASEGDGKWTLIPNGKGIERSFKFKTFKKTWVLPVLSLSPSPQNPKLKPQKTGIYVPDRHALRHPKTPPGMVKCV